ncbi:hypothetical protein IHQ71_06685 [Rhizobium sp. TH2]|uniref:calcium-binding protein n=1 Tax=Rhizobium sp. TH2 TaxID=2775403 RepID=UPI002157378C|nr:calcium-binding protein [Rhizobium sp. TH2]UVC10285.1 hypothetical protein IHQ71_06685 [Rhizobium sp. TH2]
MSDIYGTSGNDTRQGSIGSDNIFGYEQGADPNLETGNDVLSGGDGRDNIYGGGGNDTLNGGDLNDTLFGQNGDDHLYGDRGDDYLDGGEGNDTFWIGGNSTGIDTFLGGSGTDTVRLFSDLTRSEIVLDVAAGVEVLDLGNFALLGSAGSDLYDFSGVTSIINRSGAIELGNGNDIFTGHAGVDVVDGGNSNDTLQGGGGNDQLYGGTGRDLLDGGEGDDIFWIGDIDMDTFVGGAGTDAVRLMNDTSRQFLTIDITAGVEQFDANGFKLSGSIGDDIFDLSGIQQLTMSKVGIRLLDGEDSYIGHAGTDSVDGGASDDVIATGGGNDRLGGGTGADQLTGGEGRDSFVFSALPQNRLDIDLIIDFSAADDRILFDNRAFKAIGRDGKLASDAFAANASGKAQDREDRIIYDTDTGRLFYDANGSGKGKSMLIADLEAGLTLNANDFLVI